MNLSQEAGDSSSDLLYVNFNQDVTSVSVGLKTGYRLFPLTSLEHFEPSFEKDVGHEVCIIERLFSSSLIAIVELSNPRKLRVCHFKKNSEICTYSYPDTILSVKLSRQRLVVVLRQNLYIHNIRDMKVMHTIRDTPKNPSGLCALSVDNDNGFIAYPGSSQSGEIQVFDAVHLKAVAVIPAHDSPLAALTFNTSGTKLASASTTGTVIRVFSIPQGEKLLEFRRGMKRFIQINCLAFSPDDTYLASSSNTETVHIFRLIEPPQEKPAEGQQGWLSYIGKALNPSSLLPTQMTEPFSPMRAFTHLKLPRPGLKSVCTVASIEGVHRILVATSDGTLHIGDIDPNEGGDLKVHREFRLLGDDVATAGLTSQAISTQSPSDQQSYAAVASQSAHLTSGHSPSSSHDSHMIQTRESPDRQQRSYTEDDDDDKPPSAHTVHS